MWRGLIGPLSAAGIRQIVLRSEEESCDFVVNHHGRRCLRCFWLLHRAWTGPRTHRGQRRRPARPRLARPKPPPWNTAYSRRLRFNKKRCPAKHGVRTRGDLQAGARRRHRVSVIRSITPPPLPQSPRLRRCSAPVLPGNDAARAGTAGRCTKPMSWHRRPPTREA